MTIHERATAALQRAAENGYADQLRAMSAANLAMDLASYDADLEGLADDEYDQLILACQDWLTGH